MVSRANGWSVFIVWVLSAAPAWAAPSAAERETARGQMVEGDRKRDAGDNAGAIVHYRSAHALMHVPTTGLALAQAQAALGQLVEARGTALEVMGMAATDGEPAVFGVARRSAAELATRLEPKVCTLQTVVLPDSAPYTLQIDQTALPNAARSVPFKVNPGPHTVRVRARGFQPQSRTVDLAEGSTRELTFHLQPEAAPSAASAPAQAGPRLEVAASQRDDPGSGGRIRGWLALAVGGGALVAGATTGTLSWVAAANEKDRCDAQGVCDPARASALSRAKTLATVANIALPVGVLAIAYGVYELLTLPAAAPAHARAPVHLEPTAQGLLLYGEF